MAARRARQAGSARPQSNEHALPKRRTNEKLESSREELQSLNRELKALNSQLHETVEQQHATYNDLQNILISADVATLCLDSKLSIRFFTPAAKSLFNLIASDIGRPLSDLTCAAAPATTPATPRAAPSLPSRSLKSSATENPTNTGFNS